MQNRISKANIVFQNETDQNRSLKDITNKAMNSLKPTTADHVDDLRDDEHKREDVEKVPRYKKITGWDKNNRHLKTLGDVLNSKKDRSKSDSLVLEGVRNINDAMKCGLTPSIVVFSRVKLLEQLNMATKPTNCQLFHIPYTSIKMWSDLTTSPGIMAAFSKQEVQQLKAVSPLPVTLICDNIRQPDNLGALIRVAAGAGARQVILTKGCTDPWSCKAIRAGAGTHFHVPLVEGVGWDMMTNQLPDKFPQVVLADLEHGVEDDQLQDTELLHILEQKSIQDGYEEIAGELGREVAYLDTDLCEEYKKIAVRSKSYSDFNIEPGFKEVVVVVGGESEGVSGAAYRFCHRLNGSRLHVPLYNKVECLNLVSAASVVLFRVQQALLESQQT